MFCMIDCCCRGCSIKVVRFMFMVFSMSKGTMERRKEGERKNSVPVVSPSVSELSQEHKRSFCFFSLLRARGTCTVLYILRTYGSRACHLHLWEVRKCRHCKNRKNESRDGDKLIRALQMHLFVLSIASRLSNTNRFWIFLRSMLDPSPWIIVIVYLDMKIFTDLWMQ